MGILLCLYIGLGKSNGLSSFLDLLLLANATMLQPADNSTDIAGGKPVGRLFRSWRQFRQTRRSLHRVAPLLSVPYKYTQSVMSD